MLTLVRVPWRLGVDGRLALVRPERWVFTPGDWNAVEAELGVHPPPDYKQLVGAGPALVLDEELFVASPFDENPNLNLVQSAALGSFALAYLRDADPDGFAVAVHPEPDGLLCWGSDGGGGSYFWDTTDADPSRWTILVSGRSVLADPGLRYACSLSEYVDGLSDGSIPSVTLGDWPARGSRLHPRDQPDRV